METLAAVAAVATVLGTIIAALAYSRQVLGPPSIVERRIEVEPIVDEHRISPGEEYRKETSVCLVVTLASLCLTIVPFGAVIGLPMAIAARRGVASVPSGYCFSQVAHGIKWWATLAIVLSVISICTWASIGLISTQ